MTVNGSFRNSMEVQALTLKHCQGVMVDEYEGGDYDDVILIRIVPSI